MKTLIVIKKDYVFEVMDFMESLKLLRWREILRETFLHKHLVGCSRFTIEMSDIAIAVED